MHKYRRLLQYARPQRKFFALISALTLAASALAALQPWPMKLLVDHVLQFNPVSPLLQSILGTFGLRASASVFLVLGAVGGLVLFLLNAALEAVLTWAWTLAGRRMVYDLSEDLFARLQRRSLLYHSRNAVGESMSRITRDSWSVYQVFDTLCFGPAHASLTMLVMIFLMSRLDGTLTFLAVLMAPLMVGASLLVGKPLRAAGNLRREIEGRLQSHIQQTLTGIPVVQAFAQEEREQQRFEKYAVAAIQAQQRSALIGSINSLSSGLVTTLGTGVILWVGARHVLEHSLTIGGIIVFLAYLGSLQAQIKILANVYTALQGFNASVDRALNVLEGAPEVADQPNALKLAYVTGHVQIENVTFGYEPGHPVLRGLSAEARPGQTVAIVGATGAGKTTLVNLIARFFDPWTGRVIIDGKDVRDVQLRSLRSQVALVLQEPFLFPLSVAENIAFGRPEASRAEIEAAARTANAHDFIIRLPQGYDTVLGERGGTLSGGERQRLSIARALLKNAPILILDEPTSALDAQTEGLLLDALHRLMEGRTTFIIAHRLSTVRQADQILVLQHGLIEERGTHDELLARGKLYAHLHELQFNLKSPGGNPPKIREPEQSKV
jgi:ATP-binding cassette subfamily B protein/subfamily B ATP-binding cassette protein MsbA